MTIDEAANIATIVGVVLIVPQISFAIIAYILERIRDKRKATLQYYESWHRELKDNKRAFRDRFGRTITESDAGIIYNETEGRVSLHRILNSYERFALGINLGIYCGKTVARLCKNRIIENYESVEPYIIHCEEITKRRAWKEFTNLYERMKRLHG